MPPKAGRDPPAGVFPPYRCLLAPAHAPALVALGSAIVAASEAWSKHFDRSAPGRCIDFFSPGQQIARPRLQTEAIKRRLFQALADSRRPDRREPTFSALKARFSRPASLPLASAFDNSSAGTPTHAPRPGALPVISGATCRQARAQGGSAGVVPPALPSICTSLREYGGPHWESSAATASSSTVSGSSNQCARAAMMISLPCSSFRP
jgi:hypothetical protein